MAALAGAGAVTSTRRRLSEFYDSPDPEKVDNNAGDERNRRPSGRSWKNRLHAWIIMRALVFVLAALMAISFFMTTPLINNSHERKDSLLLKIDDSNGGERSSWTLENSTIFPTIKPHDNQIPDIWVKPDSYGYQQCVERRSRKHNS